MPFEILIEGFERIMSRAPYNRRRMRDAQVRAMNVTAKWVRGELQKRMPPSPDASPKPIAGSSSGQTRGRMTERVEVEGNDVVGYVGGKSLAKSGFNILRGLEEGTGLYGPNRRRIVPVTAKALRFTLGGKPVAGTGGKVVFARSVKGMQPRRPFRRTRDEAGDGARRLFARSLRTAIQEER